MKLILATHNQGKKAELCALLKDLPFTIYSLKDLGFDDAIPETGTTFAENARLKAQALASHFPDAAVLADDSGLCIDVLGGAPGVYSARFAGEDTPYPQKFAKLWESLAPYPTETWTAAFVCALCLMRPHQAPIEVEGRVEGRILPQADGDGGFGYDPIFYMTELGQSAAKASLEDKNRISHRGRALRALCELLAQQAQA